MNNSCIIILLISCVPSSSSFLFICVSLEENLYSCKHFLFHDKIIVSSSPSVIPYEERKRYSFMNRKKDKKTGDEMKQQQQQQNHPSSKDDNFYLEVLEKYTKFYKRFHPYSKN